MEAADNYRVVFSLAEFNSSFMDSEIILADTMDGARYPGALGPFRLVAPHEKRPARWVEMVVISRAAIDRSGTGFSLRVNSHRSTHASATPLGWVCALAN